MSPSGKPRVLVVGADGVIGATLERRLRETGRFEVWGTTRRRETLTGENRLHLDLRDPDDFEVSRGFDAAVLCTGVGGEAACAADPEGSRLVNVTGPVRLAERLTAAGVHVLALSSNAVFDGSREFFSTEDPPAPRTEYGRQKRDLEAALQSLPGVGILRLTKVLDGATGLPARWDRELAAGGTVEAFVNHFISPVSPEEAASVLITLIDHRAKGLFQFSGAENLSFHAYALSRYADRPDLLKRIRPVRDPAAGDGALYNSLRTELPTEEAQYDDLKGVGAQALGLMTGYAYATNPKRLAFTLSRYKFVAKMLTGKTSVLEIGCADAFGTPLVLQEVGALTAADFDWMFVREAQVSHPFRDRITFLRHDMVEGPLAGVFDAAFCLDVLEHIAPEAESRFVLNVCESLTDDGVFVVGIPSLESQVYASEISKVGHVNCKTGEDLRAFMLKFFSNVFLFSMNDEVVHTGFTPMAHYLFAIGAGKRPGLAAPGG
ncbi:MAG: sugar nucleotide-binding protein [Phenylobacterium sp.]|nr:sugar nucleotide-binding protein [Phenylobacterium sp.]